MAQNEFERRIKDHVTFKYVQEGLSLTSQIEDSPEEDEDETNVHHYIRIKTALEEVKVRVETSMLLVTVNALDRLQGSVEVLVEALRQYNLDKRYQLQNAASNHVDQMMEYMIFLPSPPTTTRRLAPTVTRLKQELDDSLNQFSVDVEEIQNKLQSGATQLQDDLLDIRNQSQDFLSDRAKAFDEKYAELEGKAQVAKDIVNAMSGYALGNQYEQEREKQGKQETYWTIAGYVLVVLLVAVSGTIFAAPLLGWVELPNSVAEGAGRFLQQSPLLGGLTAAATLVFRKAAYHRQREAQATRLKNELIMLRAFIESLDPDEQTAVLTLVAPRYFMGGSTQINRDDSTELAEILERIQRRSGSGGAEA